MRSSKPLFDSLASSYWDHFEVPHRRAYDELAWERVSALLPASGPIVDAGCGVGRWARRLLDLGYEVIGIEQAPQMVLALRQSPPGPGFTLLEASMESVELPPASVGMVLAMGSVQYTADPCGTVARFARWVRPDGVVVVLVDSLLALVAELLRAGDDAQALERARGRTGVWQAGGYAADLHLLTCADLRAFFTATGLREVEVSGLLVGGTAVSREELTARLERSWEAQMDLERKLMSQPVLADLGKQLLAIGWR
jgi:SAM-dependent methyltransferase